MRSIAVYAPTLEPNSRCREALEIFNARPDLYGLAVVYNGLPCGLISRTPLMSTFAQPDMRELYETEPVAQLMDRRPLVVDGVTSIMDVSGLIHRLTPQALVNGFVITSAGRYLGVGNGLDLLRRMAELAEQRNREVQGALRQAMDASMMKTQAIAQMSHELRTPLNAVLGFSEIIWHEVLGPLNNSKYREYAEDIHTSATHLLTLINDVFELARAEQGKIDLDLEQVDLAALVEDCIRVFQIRAQEARVALDHRIGPSLPMAHADERKIRQILLNLLSNAVKFTPEGGRVLVELAYRAPGAFRLTVADTGIGMAPEDVSKALHPFGQISNGMTRKYPGTGLGLPLAKVLVELHGGTIGITSAPGAGTTVVIELPIEAAGDEETPATATTPFLIAGLARA